MLKRWLPLLFLCCALGAAAAGQPLPPEQAFRFSARALDGRTLEAAWAIADGYYLYRDKFGFTAEPATVTATLKLGAAQIPPGEAKDDPGFGQVAVFHRAVSIRIPVEAGGAGRFTLKAVSQGCWDKGICYPPLEQRVEITLPVAAADSQAAGGVQAPAPLASQAARVVHAPSPPAPLPAGEGGTDESSRINRLLHSASLWLVLASFFGFGLALAFTPCVFPMVPILSGIIVHHGHAVTHARALALSLAYVLGMALTYAAAGVAAGYTGLLLAAALQNAWVLGGVALVFVALAFSMFGFYELQLPAVLQSRLADTANRRGGSLPAIALMGAVSALIVGPCVAAPLAGALLYIAQSGDAALGGAALFVMALGMGAPLLVVGVFSRSALPHTGPWMEVVKKCFGVLMLAVALWFVAPVIPASAAILGWAALLVIPAIYLHALDPLPPHAGGWRYLGKGVGVLMLLGGAVMFIGALGGARDPLKPLSFLQSSAAAQAQAAHPPFQRIKNVTELDAQLARATRPVLLDFYADWCVSCVEMEKFTFSDPRVGEVLQAFILLQADVTQNSAEDAALLKRFSLFGPPGIIFFDPRGQEVNRVTGFMAADDFLPELAKAQASSGVRQ